MYAGLLIKNFMRLGRLLGRLLERPWGGSKTSRKASREAPKKATGEPSTEAPAKHPENANLKNTLSNLQRKFLKSKNKK